MILGSTQAPRDLDGYVCEMGLAKVTFGIQLLIYNVTIILLYTRLQSDWSVTEEVEKHPVHGQNADSSLSHVLQN